MFWCFDSEESPRWTHSNSVREQTPKYEGLIDIDNYISFRFLCCFLSVHVITVQDMPKVFSDIVLSQLSSLILVYRIFSGFVYL
jgi:lipid-A-disaccharide synthase-like uncharacterized protein